MADEITEPWARAIFEQAITEERAADVLNYLFDGGSVTIDAKTGRIALASREALAAQWGVDP